MLAYAARRAPMALVTLLLVAMAVFTLMRLVPGDPALLMLGDTADAAQVAEQRQRMGIAEPLPVQFWRWLSAVLQGDLGHSITSQQAVAPLILERFAVSAIIVLTAVALAVLLAVPAGLLAAWKQNRALDLAIVFGATLLLSVPSFWLGLLLLLAFGLHLGWLPVVGYVPMAQDFWGGAAYLVLPIVTLVMIETGALTRMARASAIEVQRLEYVTHARAKGLPEWRVLAQHVLPNAFAPTLCSRCPGSGGCWWTASLRVTIRWCRACCSSPPRSTWASTWWSTCSTRSSTRG
jgi:peptide/nickel transport system permease protein